jgi:hypothetical protein
MWRPDPGKAPPSPGTVSLLQHVSAVSACDPPHHCPSPAPLCPAPQVRRELASLLRSVTSLVGLEPMLQQMAAMVKDAISHQQQEQQQAAPPGSPSAAAARWVTLENLMYTANVVMGAHKDDLVLPVVRELVEAAAYSVQQFSGECCRCCPAAAAALLVVCRWAACAAAVACTHSIVPACGTGVSTPAR